MISNEELQAVYDTNYAALEKDFRDRAVAYLHDELSEAVKERIRADFTKYGARWIHDGGLGHFEFGMYVRNLLRDGGFKDDQVPNGNWDDSYVPLLEAAVGVRE